MSLQLKTAGNYGVMESVYFLSFIWYTGIEAVLGTFQTLIIGMG